MQKKYQITIGTRSMGSCLGCKDRELYCHSKCEKYLAEKSRRDEIIKKMRDERSVSYGEARISKRRRRR